MEYKSAGMSSEPEPTPRPYCYRCDKPRRTCVCDSIREIANRVGVHVLQHHRERRHPIGTARLLRLGLKNVEVYPLRAEGTSACSPALPLPSGASLLYPSDDAVDIGALPPERRPSNIVVIDGTWSHAHRIYRDNPWIQTLPHVKVTPAEESRYRIRKEPRFECLSTLEAVVTALRLAEPELEGTEMLLRAFDGMIEAQIEAQSAALEARPGARRGGPAGRRPALSLPVVLREAPKRVVVVHAEPARKREAAARNHESIRLVARSLEACEVFDRGYAPHLPAGAPSSAHIGPGERVVGQVVDRALDRSELDHGVFAAFVRFCHEQAEGPPVLAYWGAWTGHLLGELFPELPRLSIKQAWSRLRRGPAGVLEDALEGAGLRVSAPGGAERAGAWLANARTLTLHIRTLGAS